jgi:hypothetical protein
MLLKIISGGQTGVDRAALDAAIKMDIEHGGWVPKGRLTEKGPLPESYIMRESESADYAERTARNIEEADATLIISRGQLTGGSALTLRLVREYRRPWRHVDLEKQAAFQAVIDISRWISAEKIEILNVAGPRASKDPQIYSKARKLLETVFYLELVHSDPLAAGGGFAGDAPTDTPDSLPTTVSQAAKRLISDMVLKDRVMLANMAEIELDGLSASLGNYILNRFELDGSNTRLLESCRWDAGDLKLTPIEAAAFILRAAWKDVRGTHKLRVVERHTEKDEPL